MITLPASEKHLQSPMASLAEKWDSKGDSSRSLKMSRHQLDDKESLQESTGTPMNLAIPRLACPIINLLKCCRTLALACCHLNISPRQWWASHPPSQVQLEPTTDHSPWMELQRKTLNIEVMKVLVQLMVNVRVSGNLGMKPTVGLGAPKTLTSSPCSSVCHHLCHHDLIMHLPGAQF